MILTRDQLHDLRSSLGIIQMATQCLPFPNMKESSMARIYKHVDICLEILGEKEE